MPSRPPALAVGLLALPPHAPARERSEARVALALLALRHGYALAECVETDGSPSSQDAALDAVEELAVRLDADGLAVAGQLDDDRVEELAARVRLVVLRHPGGEVVPCP